MKFTTTRLTIVLLICLILFITYLYLKYRNNKLKELLDDESEIDPFYGQLMGKTSLFAYLYQIDYWFKEYKMRLEE